MTLPAALASPAPRLPAVDLRRVAGDIYGSTRIGPDGRSLWWATHTPDGPGTLLVEHGGPAHVDGGLRFRAWGPGGDWLHDQAPRVVGLADEPSGFAPPAGLVRDLWRRRPLAMGRTDRVFDAAVEAVLGQRVQGVLAMRSLRRLVAAHGDVAPGPVPPGLRLRCIPHPARVAELPSFELHRLGVERTRGDTLRRVAAEASRLEAAGAAGPEALDRRLRSIRGVGVWTSALVRTSALGDPDAVPVGDHHVCHAIVWALTGRPRGSDDEMLELLEPFRPHRGRVVALLFGRHGPAPRFGPRLEVVPVDHLDRPGVGFRDRGPFGRRRA